MSFSGKWEESGSIPQDTASFTNRFTLVQQGDRVTGEYVREVSAVSPEGVFHSRIETRDPIDAPIVDGAVTVELGRMIVSTTLRLENDQLMVNGRTCTRR